MDAAVIYAHYKAERMVSAVLQDGPTLTDILVKKMMRGGMHVLGSYIPRRDAVVTIFIDDFSVEGVVKTRNDVQCTITYLRPATGQI